MSKEKIIIKSGENHIISDIGDIVINSKTSINSSANTSITFDVGIQNQPQPTNTFLVNSPLIELGIPTPSKPQESIVKGQQLENRLGDILDLISLMAATLAANAPTDEVDNMKELQKMVDGKVKNLKKQIKQTIHSTVSKTV